MMYMDNNNYNKNLKQFARNHRKDGTKAEIKLWCEVLRSKQMMGYPFLRQRPIANYIADFFSKDLNLVIEGWIDPFVGRKRTKRYFPRRSSQKIRL